MKIVSKAQARFLGAVRSGKVNSPGAPTPAKAAKMMHENRGFRMSALPERAAPRMNRRSAPRLSSRGGR